jgi:hypothetical protein
MRYNYADDQIEVRGVGNSAAVGGEGNYVSTALLWGNLKPSYVFGLLEPASQGPIICFPRHTPKRLLFEIKYVVYLCTYRAFLLFMIYLYQRMQIYNIYFIYCGPGVA